ncbi:cation:proton antiporter domain-containing protein [Thiorhodovibrio frisius]|uniref:Kef-type K+ transport system, membrane component n=1 Tax=Thiorhodovibrio frisius TaxID=631362 RepID=H8Z5K6_9GAMM|nr:cation:proton antiporter [Thiorhodovibrio frisius]EIC20576.1 Kef-type K+ transport system, membrane component [Thiorhodovibrio frisius]WPL21324.1 K(+)/H(+) antiporter [Thiorhodovibrio frisius]
MEAESFVSSAVLLLVVAALAVAIFRHFGLGSILGLLVAGVLLGPHTPGPSVTNNVEDLRHFAELGVVLLLFVIGIEMHPGRLWELRRTLFGLGSLQVLLTGLALAAYFRLFQPDWSTALLIGMSLALSSTALVVQMLQERGDMASCHGQTAFAVLLMQDLAVVPLLALMPVLADVGPLPEEIPLWQQVGTVVALVSAVILVGRYLVPWVLERLSRQGNRDAFFLVVLASVFLAAAAMEHAGLSMALGAFLMGVMLSGSRFSLQIQALVEPHKGLLMSLFFVAVGMSVDLSILIDEPLQFGEHLASILAIKILVLFLLCLVFGVGRAAAFRVAFLLSQAGEFGFVLFGAAKLLRLIDDRTFVLLVAVISVSMLLTPLLVALGEWLARRAPGGMDGVDGSLRLPEREAGSAPARVIIAGFGRVGHTIGAILTGHGISYVAFESNPELVASWHREGCPVYYGDIGDPHLLEAAEVEQADLVVLTIDDQRAAINATQLIRAYAPDVKIVARARDLTTCDALLRAGATQAFPEAVEASLRLAAETLSALGLGTQEVDMLLNNVRGTGYALVREEVPEDLAGSA